MWSVYINRTSPEVPFTFENLLALQDAVLKKIIPSGGRALLFAEVSPTVTLGARQIHDEREQTALLKLKNKLEELGVSVVSGERGGKETWHGPGQWVCFVLTPLLEFTGDPRGVRKAVHLILEKVLTVVQAYEPRATIDEGARLGIWSERGKLVSIGIKIKQNYLTSGFALNCMPHGKSFLGIDPCGVQNAGVDFLFLGRVPVENWSSEFLEITKKIERSF